MSGRRQKGTSKGPTSLHVQLRDPAWAALLAWLWPGAGHLYQRRYGKGILFMICVLGTFFYGLSIGGGHVVYASWRPNDYRWQYACQLGTGLPAMPALLQSIKTKGGGDPYFVTREFDSGEFPHMKPFGVDGKLKEGFMAPPPGVVLADNRDVVALWYEELGEKYELGTLFTVVAGILNILAVYDAFAGPALIDEEEESEAAND